MARQNVGTPRFYIDLISYYNSLGMISNFHWSILGTDYTALGLNPTNPVTLTSTTVSDSSVFNVVTFDTPIPAPTEKMWMGILGHNLASQTSPQLGVDFNFKDSSNIAEGYNINTVELVNWNGGELNPLSNNGFTLVDKSSIGLDNIKTYILRLTDPEDGGAQSIDVKIGSSLFGTYYDMPHSPNLDITMSREYNVKHIKTKGGAVLSNSQWIRPKGWSMPHFQLSDTISEEKPSIHRTGRRGWELSFDSLESSDLMSKNEGVTASGTEYEYPGGLNEDQSLNVSDNFYSQVIHKTLGGQLPFLFQPDNTNFNPDAFSIARLDMDSFGYKQVANNIYNIKLKIVESW